MRTLFILFFTLPLIAAPKTGDGGSSLKGGGFCNASLLFDFTANTTKLKIPLKAIISGGQTGADRAAIDVALEFGIPISGWIPKGRPAFDGPLDPKKYPLKETESSGWEERSKLNAKDSDGSLAVTWGGVTGGTGWTQEFAEKLGRPFMVVKLHEDVEPQYQKVIDWILESKLEVLNVAGPSDPKIYEPASNFMRELLKRLDKASLKRK